MRSSPPPSPGSTPCDPGRSLGFALGSSACHAARLAEPYVVAGSGRGPRVTLTAREHQVLLLVGEGLTSGQIAAATGLSRHTVDSYVGAACARLGVRSRTVAALLVSQHHANDAAPWAALDPEVVRLLEQLAAGRSVPDGARSVGLSTRSAYRLLARARQAMGASSRVDLLRRASRLGIIAPATSSAGVRTDTAS